MVSDLFGYQLLQLGELGADTLGAGEEDFVLITQGISARLTPETKELPIDAVNIGIVDTVNLGRNSIRFDQAQNISPPDHEHYYNGDSLTIDVVAVRTGAALTGRPLMHYKLQRNTLFDPYRTAGLPDSGVIGVGTDLVLQGGLAGD